MNLWPGEWAGAWPGDWQGNSAADGFVDMGLLAQGSGSTSFTVERLEPAIILPPPRLRRAKPRPAHQVADLGMVVVAKASVRASASTIMAPRTVADMGLVAGAASSGRMDGHAAAGLRLQTQGTATLTASMAVAFAATAAVQAQGRGWAVLTASVTRRDNVVPIKGVELADDEIAALYLLLAA